MYNSDSSKWKAYQFSDPFASNSFCVCNKITRVVCRPDCDARPITTLKSEVKFVDSASEALSLGFQPCESCDPINGPHIDVNLLIKCVASINDKLGFCPPLLDDNEERNNAQIKRNIIESKKYPDEPRARRMSMVSFSDRDLESANLSKNDSDHYRLVDLACRHLALAAAMNYFHIPSPKPSPSSPEDSSKDGSRKRRRRGGVLGFKELAAKSKLSAWHFHRVFKSVTGLTPKTYGDKCWDFFKNYTADDSLPLAPVSSTTSASLPPSPADMMSPRKRVKLEPNMPAVVPMVPFGQVDGAVAMPELDDFRFGGFQFPTKPQFDLDRTLVNDNLLLFPQHARSASMPDPVATMHTSPGMPPMEPPMDEFSVDMFQFDENPVEVPEIDDLNANYMLNYPELTTFTS
ncbi:hypothetical protein DICA3_E16490 [Diutina catenulata]